MKVAELMTCDVKACSPHDFLNAAARIMWENDCDVCMAAYLHNAPLTRIRVELAMAPTVITCGPQDDLDDARDLMRQNRVHRLPVTDAHGKLLGILSLSNVVIEAERQRRAQRGTRKAAELLEVFGALCEPRSHVESHLTPGPEQDAEFPAALAPRYGHLHKAHLHGTR